MATITKTREAADVRKCRRADCDGIIGPGAHGLRRYCSERCRIRTNKAKEAAYLRAAKRALANDDYGVAKALLGVV